MSADVVADMLTTKCSHPMHGAHVNKFYLDSLLPLIVDGRAVDVCYQCFKDPEADNAGAPKGDIDGQVLHGLLQALQVLQQREDPRY
jgi:hypothetical protein